VGTRAGVAFILALSASAGLRYDERSGCVEGVHVDAPISVYFGTATTPVLGDFDASRQRFCPRFPFLPGREHRATAGPETLVFTPPSTSPSQASSKAIRISPAIAEWPANLLRFYVWFPAGSGGGNEPIHLMDLDRDGSRPVPSAFLDIPGGLWDRSEAQRLTMFFHPGRVKRGLQAHEQLGPPLIAGHRYRIEVGAFHHDFRAIADDRDPPDPKTWQFVNVPLAGSRDPLRILTDGPLDEAIAKRAIYVEGLDTSVELDTSHRIVQILPAHPWTAGDHRIRIESFLEDLAGNRPGKLFDAPMGQDRKQPDTTVLKIVLRSP
jgi:hypothetical protein